MSTVTTTILPAARAQRTLIDPGEFRVVFRGVPFQVYKTLLDATPETSAVRLAYDGKDLEIMTVSRLHERSKGFFGRFIEIVTLELSIPCDDAGQTTWVREDAARGLEADESYYLDPAKIQAAVECDNAGVPNIEAYPVPDIGVEIDSWRPGGLAVRRQNPNRGDRAARGGRRLPSRRVEPVPARSSRGSAAMGCG
jgi:hypothetical protein